MKKSISIKFIYKCETNPIKVSTVFPVFHENWQIVLKFIWENEWQRIPKKKLKRIKSGICLLGIKNFYGIQTLYKVYIESVVNSSPESDLYTNWILEYNPANVANQLMMLGQMIIQIAKAKLFCTSHTMD